LTGSTGKYQVTLYIDFAHGTLRYDSTGGTALTGSLTLPDSGQGAMQLNVGGNAPLWGVPAVNVHLSAVQVSDRNLLKTMPMPH
jgi:hypothetical protein